MRCPRQEQLPLGPEGMTGWPRTEESAQLPNIMQDGPSWPKINMLTSSYNQGQFIRRNRAVYTLPGIS